MKKNYLIILKTGDWQISTEDKRQLDMAGSAVGFGMFDAVDAQHDILPTVDMLTHPERHKLNGRKTGLVSKSSAELAKLDLQKRMFEIKQRQTDFTVYVNNIAVENLFDNIQSVMAHAGRTTSPLHIRAKRLADWYDSCVSVSIAKLSEYQSDISKPVLSKDRFIVLLPPVPSLS